jgi:histidinol-phosphate/aromatic aminotransferase/cobyric acid decarboxylase-like protein
MKRFNVKPFQNKQFKVQKGAGPVYTYNKSRPVPEGVAVTQNVKKELTKEYILCGNGVDNVVQYVYENLPTGDHSAYVDCDYVD